MSALSIGHALSIPPVSCIRENAMVLSMSICIHITHSMRLPVEFIWVINPYRSFGRYHINFLTSTDSSILVLDASTDQFELPDSRPMSLGTVEGTPLIRIHLISMYDCGVARKHGRGGEGSALRHHRTKRLAIPQLRSVLL